METFKVSVGGQEKELYIRDAKAAEIKEANKVKSKAYWKAIKDGLPLANDAVKLAQQTSWTPEKIEEVRKLEKELADHEETLTKKRNLKLGGPLNKDENTMFRVALKCLGIRNRLVALKSLFAEAQENTVEGYAENERLNYILYATTVYKDSGERVFESFEDFENSTFLADNNAEKYQLIMAAFEAYKSRLQNSVQTILDMNPENTFFKRFKFINDNGDFIDKEGKPIDSNGDKVLEVLPKIEKPIPFLDDDGNPIEDEEYKAELLKYESALANTKHEPSKT